LSGTYYTLSGDFDSFKQNVKTNDLSVNNITLKSGNNINFLSDVSFNQNVNITGDLIIDGSFNFNEVIQNITTVNNEILVSTQLDISNQGTGPALEVTQIGTGDTNDVALFKSGVSDSDKAFEIKHDGKSIFYKDVSFIGKIIGDISNESFNDLSGKHYTLSGEFDNFKENVKTNDLSVNNITVRSGSKITITAQDVSFNGKISGTDASFTALSVGKLMGYSPIEVMSDLSLNRRLIVHDASFSRIQAIDNSMILVGDLSVNGNIFFSDNLYQNGTLFEGGGGGGGGSGTDVSFDRIGEFTNGIGTRFENTIDVTGKVRASDDVISFYSSSDSRLKTNIRKINNATEIIKNIRGIRFNWNHNAYDLNSNVDLSKDEIGVIAQEIEKHLPEVIKTGLNNYKAVRYENIVAVLIEGMHELQNRIQVLENEVNLLKK